ncbi:MAG: hypothetical protein WCC01_02465 [Acidimicrobiia bacterium]
MSTAPAPQGFLAAGAAGIEPATDVVRRRVDDPRMTSDSAEAPRGEASTAAPTRPGIWLAQQDGHANAGEEPGHR